MKRIDAFVGALSADAVSMPVHWYYDTAAMRRDYGVIRGFTPPRNPHPDSILWRSSHVPVNADADILHDQARWWGVRGVHYHQFLQAGENTLNYQLAIRLYEQLCTDGEYHAANWLETYVDFMRTPGRHRDTYVEEYHRAFFNNLARGKNPSRCGIADIHIGGLVPVAAIFSALPNMEPDALRAVVRQHVGLTHQAPDVLAAADCLTRMLVAIQSGTPVRESIASHSDGRISPKRFTEWLREPDEIIVGRRLSPACYIQDAFPAALYLAWKYHQDFPAGIFANANVGGDNCHRAAVVGAILGLANGVPTKLVPNAAHQVSRPHARVQTPDLPTA